MGAVDHRPGRDRGPLCDGENLMDLSMLTNRTVTGAIAALQQGDRTAWLALFEPDAKLYDDGSPRSLKEFTRDAVGHERFTSIERVDTNGLDLLGEFQSEPTLLRDGSRRVPRDPIGIDGQIIKQLGRQKS